MFDWTVWGCFFLLFFHLTFFIVIAIKHRHCFLHWMMETVLAVFRINHCYLKKKNCDRFDKCKLIIIIQHYDCYQLIILSDYYQPIIFSIFLAEMLY